MQDDCHEGLGREGASFGRAEYLGPVGGLLIRDYLLAV